MMREERDYPPEPVGPFPEPPMEFADAEGREIRIEPLDEDVEPVVDMYVDFDPADRAQGLPPIGEERVRDWLSTLTAEDGYNVVAWHGDSAIGHATLVPDGEDAYELAIFVHQDYQGAGVGTRLIRGLLGHAKADGVERVWLTVERWNTPAINLYEKVGFETATGENFEHEMGIRLN